MLLRDVKRGTELTTTTRTSYGAPTMGRRAPVTLADQERDTMHEVIQPAFHEAMESWLSAAPSFEASIVMRMLASLSTKVYERTVGNAYRSTVGLSVC